MTPRILKNNIVISNPNVGQLQTLFPDKVRVATVGGQQYAAVPYTLGSARVLRNLGYDVPSPIRTQYEWPGRFTPRWYQIDTAEFFTLNPRAHCHSAPRTGKTLSTLWAADYLRQQSVVHRTLIVAPLSTLWDVWEQNVFESFPLRTFCVLHGSREKRLKLLAEPYDFYIINHHGVQLVEQELKNRPDIDLLILDEVAAFRNVRAKTLFKPVDRVVNRQGIFRWCWGLTGTPTPNEPTDAFGQCRLVTPDNYKRSFTQFKRDTMLQVSEFKWVPLRTSAETVARVLSPSIRFERSVCTDMEPVFISRRAELSAEQKKAYKQLINLACTEVSGSVVTAVNAAVLVSKLVQTACGVVLDAEGKPVRMDFGPRLSVLEELITNNTEKVLVFVPFTGVLNALAEKLRKKWSVAVVDGSVSVRKRTDIFRNFRARQDPHVLVCHPQVMAHGLDLTTASLSIWYAPFWKAETYQQANARTDGSRQKTKIDIAHIYATKEEQRIYSVLKTKGKLQDVVLELSRDGGVL
jgi:SNF2 family DNA or RNA helicase